MNFQYQINYDSSLLRGKDDPLTPRPWDLRKEILVLANHNKNLLDVGCGTSFKLVPIAHYFNEVFAVDINHQMVLKSKYLLEKNKIKNTTLLTANSNCLPFANNSFDIITHMLSRFNAKEIFRVLKPNGTVVVEYPGCEDKKEFKKIFGKDAQGWRGQFIDFEKEAFIDNIYKQFNQYFSCVVIKSGFWNTFYTEEGIIELLKYTPTIRNFNIELDKQSIGTVLKLFTTKQGIKLNQNRILIYAANH